MSLLEEKLSLDPKILLLLEKSPHKGRIEKLMVPSELNKKICLNKDYLFSDQPPNCFGTVLYLLGIIREPVWVDRYSMVCFISQNCREEKTDFGLNYFISFWTEQGLSHCGLYLGEANGEGIMFHQLDTGELWKFGDTKKYTQENPGITNVIFYGFKNQVRLWLPSELEIFRTT